MLEQQSKKWLYLVYLILGCTGVYLVHRVLGGVAYLAKFAVGDVIGVPMTVLVALALCAVGVVFAYKRTAADAFSQEVLVELSKVAWPSRKETSASIVIVVFVVIFFGVYLGLLDFAWTSLLKYVL